MSRQSISRRQLLRGAGVLGAGLFILHFSQTTLAQSAPSTADVVAFQRFDIGNFKITALYDGSFVYPVETLGINAGDSAVTSLLSVQNLPGGEMVNGPVTILLVDTGSRQVLVDTGLSNFTLGETAGGKLFATLNLLGVERENITDVVITHFHPDHIAGAAFDDEPAFPHAQYHFPQAEWDFLQAPPVVEENVSALLNLASAKLHPAEQNDQLALFMPEAEIVPGIQALATPGHTPGHVSLLIDSNGHQLLNLADAVIHAAVSVQHPEWHMGFDAIPDLAVASRRAILERAATEQIQVFGYHFPFPGVGYVARANEGFQFFPQL